MSFNGNKIVSFNGIEIKFGIKIVTATRGGSFGGCSFGGGSFGRHCYGLPEGDFITVMEGAYYAKAIAEAKREGRIGRVSRDPLMTLRAIWDIGGTAVEATQISTITTRLDHLIARKTLPPRSHSLSALITES